MNNTSFNSYKNQKKWYVYTLERPTGEVVIYPISWRFCAIKRVAIGLRSVIRQWTFSHNLSLHLTSSIQVGADGLNCSDNIAYISEKWLVKPCGFFSHNLSHSQSKAFSRSASLNNSCMAMSRQIMRGSPSAERAWQRGRLSEKPGKIDVK